MYQIVELKKKEKNAREKRAFECYSKLFIFFRYTLVSYLSKPSV